MSSMSLCSLITMIIGCLLLRPSQAYRAGRSWRSSNTFTAVKEDGTVQGWGWAYFHYPGVPGDLKDVTAVYSTDASFAALKKDGTVRVWGDKTEGGTGVPADLKDVRAIYSTVYAFAALKEDGTVQAWGREQYGTSVPAGLKNVRALYSHYAAFAALKEDGTVKSWGKWTGGGFVSDDDLVDVTGISSTKFSFAALKKDGTVTAWGGETLANIVPVDLTEVNAIFSNDKAFAALKSDGTVRAWGDPNYGGFRVPADLAKVRTIFSSESAFAALKSDGTVQAWGGRANKDMSKVPKDLANVQTIFSTSNSFAALKEDGTVQQWGVIKESVPSDLANVTFIASSNANFAALKEDGTVQVWGDSSHKVTSVPTGLSGVTAIFGSVLALCALTEKGALHCWGGSTYGGKNPNGLANVKIVFSGTERYADSTTSNYYPCPHGTYGPGPPNCTACPSGSNQPRGLPGVFSDIGSCIKCPRGKYSSDGRTCSKECPNGYQFTPYNWFDAAQRCVAAFKGYYLDSQVDPAVIRSCAVGRYQDKEAQSSCLPCAAGTYSGEGAARCSACPIGKTVLPGLGYGLSDCFKVCPMGQYGSFDTCHNCPAGSYNNQTTGTDLCKLCDLGKVQPRTGQSSCSSCEKGKWTNTRGTTKCFDCPPGSSCGEVGMTNPSECAVGRYTDVKLRWNCTACSPGRYQPDTGSAKCHECEPGTFNDKEKSVSIIDCKVCEAGKYAPQKGSAGCRQCGKGTFTSSAGKNIDCTTCPEGKTSGFGATACVVADVPCDPGEHRAVTGECVICAAGYYSPSGTGCLPCPPGSFCGKNGIKEPEECPRGRYTDVKMAQSCTSCPAGRFQNSTGAAKCLFCERGKYLPLSDRVANSSALCMPCSAGTYGDKEGLGECTPCAIGQVQSDTGQTSCKDCILEGKIKTNNEAHTACINNMALLSSTVVEVMFTKGLALSVAFAIAGAFVSLAWVTHFIKAKCAAAGELGALKYHDMLIKSFLPGFSFGSEICLITGIMSETPAIGMAMLLFRCLHPVAVAVLCMGMFLSDYTGSEFLRDMMKNASLHKEFMKNNVPLISVLLLTCIADVTMIQLMPFKQSEFYTESKGYPSMAILKFCLSVKTVQAIVSVACQLIYVNSKSDLDDPTMSTQAKILFGLSIAFSTTNLLMGLVMFFLRSTLLGKEDPSEELERVQSSGDEVEMGIEHELQQTVHTDNPMLAAAATEQTVYTDNPMLAAAATEQTVYTDNPMLAAAATANAEGARRMSGVDPQSEDRGEGSPGREEEETIVAELHEESDHIRDEVEQLPPQQKASQPELSVPPPLDQQPSSEASRPAEGINQRLMGFASVAKKPNTLTALRKNSL